MLVNYDIEERRRGKMKADDRVLVLQPMEGKKPLTTDGSVDARLFKGENNLHVIYNVNDGAWKMAYEMGGLPGGLQGKFTTFGEAVSTARAYYAKRNVEIADIKE